MPVEGGLRGVQSQLRQSCRDCRRDASNPVNEVCSATFPCSAAAPVPVPCLARATLQAEGEEFASPKLWFVHLPHAPLTRPQLRRSGTAATSLHPGSRALTELPLGSSPGRDDTAGAPALWSGSQRPLLASCWACRHRCRITSMPKPRRPAPQATSTITTSITILAPELSRGSLGFAPTAAGPAANPEFGSRAASPQRPRGHEAGTVRARGLGHLHPSHGEHVTAAAGAATAAATRRDEAATYSS
eukprot:COSAG01_NODE_592_length_15109_cov_39.247435_18_plen_245_part_00